MIFSFFVDQTVAYLFQLQYIPRAAALPVEDVKRSQDQISHPFRETKEFGNLTDEMPIVSFSDESDKALSVA